MPKQDLTHCHPNCREGTSAKEITGEAARATLAISVHMPFIRTCKVPLKDQIIAFLSSLT